MAILHKEESYAIIGACFEVYRELGCGFLEPVYQESLRIEFGLRGIPHVPKPRLELAYKGQLLEQHYEPDFFCYGSIVVELKAVSTLSDVNRAQIHNYLKATGHRLGLLVFFGHHPKIEHERIVR